MLRRILLAAACLGSVAVSITSALAQVGAPQLGWVPDGSGIRLVYGLPSAAAVGALVLPDQSFAKIAGSPARNYVLVSDGNTGAVSVYTPEHGLAALDGASAAPDALILSPRGSAALLWFSSNGQLQVITGLPDAPAVRQLDVSFLGPASGALAVSDDGAWVAGTSAAGTYLFGPDSSATPVPAGSVTALAFLQGSHDLGAAGPTGLELITGVGGFPIVSSLLTSGDSSLQPVAIASSGDNGTLILADRSGAVTAVNISSGAAATSDCGCIPEGLFGLGTSAFRLTGLNGGAFTLFDAAHGEILLAPLALDSAAQSEGAGQ